MLRTTLRAVHDIMYFYTYVRVGKHTQHQRFKTDRPIGNISEVLW